MHIFTVSLWWNREFFLHLLLFALPPVRLILSFLKGISAKWMINIAFEERQISVFSLKIISFYISWKKGAQTSDKMTVISHLICQIKVWLLAFCKYLWNFDIRLSYIKKHIFRRYTFGHYWNISTSLIKCNFIFGWWESDYFLNA